MNQSKLPAALSALIVIGVLAVLGMMLYNRSGGSQATLENTNQPAVPAELAEQGEILEQAEATAVTMAEATSVAEAAPEAGTVALEDAGPVAALPPVERNQMYSAAPPMTIDTTSTYTATIATPRGDIVVRLLPEIAPQTVNSFVFLAREGFYDNLSWHRVIADFMAQGGDPSGTGEGGPGYNVPAEFSPALSFDRPGLVAMARRGADVNSAGSQFFITTAAAPWLDGQYTIFGEVVQGQEIVNSIPLRDPATATQPGEAIIAIRITEG